MVKRYFFRITVLFFAIIFFTANAQAQHLDSLLNNADANYPQEKIYLQYDRPYYNPGETIWFKAYIYPTNFPFHISRTAYAELINEKGVILERKIMPVVEHGAASNFTIPDTVKSGVLYVRAYTAWMLNFDSTLQYLKPLRIVTKANVKPAKIAETVTLNLFPEGGDLISSVISRIAFKATNQDGDPVSVSGNIVDSKGTIITTFSSTHDGMGIFSILPYADDNYKAVWKDKKGVAHETALPTAKKHGVSLKVFNKRTSLTYILERPEDATEDFKAFYVIAKMQTQLLYSARINMAVKTKVAAAIAIDSLQDGIVQVTIFNAQQIPVAERLIFVDHGSYSFITDLHAPQLDLGKRKKNTLQIDIGDTTFSNLSIAVTDESLTTPPTNRENIFSQMLLSSDLKGNVYNPAQYFASDEDSLKDQLDLVMMTNGWRRIKWQEIISGKLPPIKQLPESYLAISGTVYGLPKIALTGREISGIIKTKSGGSDFLLVPVNQDGTFRLEDVYLFDTAQFFYQFNNDKDKKLSSKASFTFNPSYQRSPTVFPGLLHNSVLPPRADTATERKNIVVTEQVRNQFFEGNKIKDLSTVVVKTKIKTPEQKMDEEYASGFFSGGDGYTFLPDTDPFAKGAQTILNYLQAKVAGMQVSTGSEPSVTWRGSPTGVFLNESPTDLSMVQNISMSDVAMIKVYRPPFFGASGGGAGGAIAIYLKKGASANQNVKGLDFVNIAGYSEIKEFYSPDYDKTTDVGTADLRSTLYWNPFLLFDKNTRRIMIPFFNNDNAKKIRVIIEGMNRLGQFTREEKVFQ